jgi:hypothetical protein
MVSSEEDVGSEGEVDYSKIVKEIEDMDMPNTIITKLISNAVSTIIYKYIFACCPHKPRVFILFFCENYSE